MVDSFIRTPPDSTGKKVAAQQKTRGVDDVQIQEVLTSYPADGVSTGVNVTTSNVSVLPANAARRALLLQNISDQRIFCRFGTAAVAIPGSEIGIALEANGGSGSFIAVSDQRDLNVVHAGVGTKRLLITEWSN